MALHISGKLCVLGVVLAALITAFSAPVSEGVPVQLAPQVNVLDSPRVVEADALSLNYGPEPSPSFQLRATAYNSMASQTDSTPHITATGAVTRFGIVAVSRDLLADDIPYGSLVRLRDLGSYSSGRGAGAFQSLLDGQQLFVVEDTMHLRKRKQLDVWFPDLNSARAWGVRRLEVEVVRYGRDGPLLVADPVQFDAQPVMLASR